MQFFFKLLPKFSTSYKFWWLYRKNNIEIYQTISSFCSKKYFTLIKKGLFLIKKWEIQVPNYINEHMRYTGSMIFMAILLKNVWTVILWKSFWLTFGFGFQFRGRFLFLIKDIFKRILENGRAFFQPWNLE